MGHNDFGRGKAVGVLGTGEASNAVEETFQLTLRVVKPASARPAVGSCVDRLIPMGASHAGQF